MNREEDIIKLIQQMCDDDREEEVVRMIDNLPDEERTYKIVGLQARTLSNLAGMIRSGYTESELNPDDLDRRALSILANTAEEGKDDPNWWCRNGYTRMGLNMEAEAIPFFEHVMTLIPDDPETQEFWSDVPEAIENCKKTVEFLEHPTLREPPYIKKRSVMIAVSRVDDFTADMQAFRNRLGDIAGLESLEFEDVSQNTETNTIEHVHGQFCGEPFDMEIDRLEAFNASGMFISSYFNKQDLELIGQERPGYGIDIRFGTANPLAWLHLQLKIATALVPKLLAIYDLSSQQALSEAYVVSTARSSSGPHASFAYSIASESNEQGSDTWLYTNGLARFGLPDIEIMHSDYILFARARGETTRQLVVRHGLRNIALPAITLQFASFSELFGGIALAESVFSYPGLGSALTAAALNADAPLLIGIAMFSALFVFAGNSDRQYSLRNHRSPAEGRRVPCLVLL